MSEGKEAQDDSSRSVEEIISDRFYAISKESKKNIDDSRTANDFFDKGVVEKLRQYVGGMIDDFDVGMSGDVQLFYVGIGEVVFELYKARFSGKLPVMQLAELTDGLKQGVSLKSVGYKNGYTLELARTDKARSFFIVSDAVNIEEKR